MRNKIFIVRHGESENNLLKIDCSKLENKDLFDLTESGRNQVTKESENFNSFDLIITSPLKRAVETAKLFALTSQCKLIENELLIEVNYGDLELCSYDESDKWFKENGSDDSVAFPNGESLLDAKQRAVDFLQQLSQLCSDEKVLVVTHGYIVLFLQELLDESFNMKHARDNYSDDESRKVIEIRSSSH